MMTYLKGILHYHQEQMEVSHQIAQEAEITIYAKCYMQSLYVRVKLIMKLQYWLMDIFTI